MTIQDLEQQQLLLLNCISGSHAYGLQTPASDIDKRGIFILPKAQFYGLNDSDQVSDRLNDEVYYELSKFMNLLVKNNPNILELLRMPADCTLFKHPLIAELRLEDFITKRCRHTFAGYAIAQIKKARGLNKKIVNPMEKERKSLLHFCYVQHGQGSITLLEFLKLKGIHQEDCGLVNIPHMKNSYALFHSSKTAYAGIISGPDANDISLSSVAKGEQPIGIMYCNLDGYSVYCKEHKQYWEWVSKRNESRYQSTMNHGKNYDAKNMMHTFRLLHMAEEIATTGTFEVRRTKDRDFLLQIRSGAFEYDELVQAAEDKLAKIESLFDRAPLPETLAYDKANAYLLKIRSAFYDAR